MRLRAAIVPKYEPTSVQCSLKWHRESAHTISATRPRDRSSSEKRRVAVHGRSGAVQGMSTLLQRSAERPDAMGKERDDDKWQKDETKSKGAHGMPVHKNGTGGDPGAGAYRSSIVRCPVLVGIGEYRKGKRCDQARFEEQSQIWIGRGRVSVILQQKACVHQQQKEEEPDRQKYLAADYLRVLPKRFPIPNFPAGSENRHRYCAQHVQPEDERAMGTREREAFTPLDVPRDQSVERQICSCPE